jgi:hypothetical protein
VDSNPSLERASLNVFYNGSGLAHLSRFRQAKGTYALGAPTEQNAGDLACCGLLLLIEKSPSMKKHLKQQILIPNQSQATSSEVLRSLDFNPNNWYHIC